MPGPDSDDDGWLRSRTDLRNERIETEDALWELSAWLVKQGEKTLAKLDLTEDALGAVHDAKRIENPSARKRALRLVRTALRAMDAETLRRKIDALAFPAAKTEAETTADGWATRLLSGTDADVTSFVEAFPVADRQRVRQLVRNAKKLPEEQATKARNGLSKGLLDYVAARPEPSESAESPEDE